MQQILVRLTPKASVNKIGDYRINQDGAKQLMVYVTAVPEDSKANEAMIGLLAKHFKVAISKIKIIKGSTNRNKTVLIEE